MNRPTQSRGSATGDILLGLVSASALTVVGFLAGKSGGGGARRAGR